MTVLPRFSFDALLLLALANMPVVGAQAAPSASMSDDALVRIVLPLSVQVTRSAVNLGDVASVSSSDPALLKRLQRLPLGAAPFAGESIQLSRAELMRWIEARTRIHPARIACEGAQATQVRRAGGEIAGEHIAVVAGKSLRAWFATRSERAQVSVASTLPDVKVPLGHVALKVRAIPEDAPLSRRMLVWVDIWVDAQFVRTVPVSFEVQAFAPAYVAQRDLPAGAKVQSQAFAVQEVALAGHARPLKPVDGGLVSAGQSQHEIPHESQREPQQLRGALAAGQVLAQKNLRPGPVVARGDWVTLRMRTGDIDIESRVEALQNGFLGQSVSVKQSNASAPVVARVVGSGKVELTQ